MHLRSAQGSVCVFRLRPRACGQCGPIIIHSAQPCSLTTKLRCEESEGYDDSCDQAMHPTDLKPTHDDRASAAPGQWDDRLEAMQVKVNSNFDVQAVGPSCINQRGGSCRRTMRRKFETVPTRTVGQYMSQGTFKCSTKHLSQCF